MGTRRSLDIFLRDVTQASRKRAVWRSIDARIDARENRAMEISMGAMDGCDGWFLRRTTGGGAALQRLRTRDGTARGDAGRRDDDDNHTRGFVRAVRVRVLAG